jgi:hypothetical protein
MIDKVKELRIQIDGIAQLTKELKPLDALWENPDNAPDNAVFKHIMINSNEIKEAHKSLLLAKAWLGKVLQELGEENPYKNDGNRKTVADIESATDKNEDGKILIYSNKEQYQVMNNAWKVDENKTLFNNIEKVDWLREEIQKLIDIKGLNLRGISNHAFIKSIDYLIEARFWLGFELQRIKENGNT